MAPKHQDNFVKEQSRKCADVISLILTRDAYVLRHKIAENLWRHIEQKYPDAQNLSKALCEYGLSPKGFKSNCEELFLHDIEAFNDCWKSLSAGTQNTLHTAWGVLPSKDKSEKDLTEKFNRIIEKQTWNPFFEDMAKRFPRYSQLYTKIAVFWNAWTIYGQQQSFGKSTSTAYENLLRTWEELFSVLVVPVSRSRNADYLCVFCPNSRFRNVHKYFTNIDTNAYQVFQRYTQKHMQDINCTSYRNILNGGIRSLNCYVFNRLKALNSKDEHSEAILFGCRSGVQYQVLANPNISSQSIIGMVTVYFPLYDFFERFGFIKGNGSLICKSNSEQTDEEYKRIWHNDFTAEQLGDPNFVLARLLLKPFFDCTNHDIMAIRRHLEIISLSSGIIRDFIIDKGLSANVEQVLTELCHEFTPDAAKPLNDWLESTMAQLKTITPQKPSQEIPSEVIPSVYCKEKRTEPTENISQKTIPASAIKGKVHVAIITVRHDEYEAMEAMFGEMFRVRGKNTYKHATVLAESGSISVVLTRLVRQGNTSAQSVTSNVIQDIDPAWLFLVGIAGGVPDYEYSLGDVIIATHLHDFSLQAAKELKESGYETSGGPMHREVERFLQTDIVGRDGRRLCEMAGFNTVDGLINHPEIFPETISDEKRYYGDTDHQNKVKNTIQKRFPKGKRAGGPIVYSRPCANGNILVKDTKLLAQWQKSARDVTHVETELVGVYEAARSNGREDYPVLAIRGLSDIIGFERDHNWTPYACKTAAAFTHAVLKSGFIDFAKNLPPKTD